MAEDRADRTIVESIVAPGQRPRPPGRRRGRRDRRAGAAAARHGLRGSVRASCSRCRCPAEVHERPAPCAGTRRSSAGWPSRPDRRSAHSRTRKAPRPSGSVSASASLTRLRALTASRSPRWARSAQIRRPSATRSSRPWARQELGLGPVLDPGRATATSWSTATSTVMSWEPGSIKGSDCPARGPGRCAATRRGRSASSTVVGAVVDHDDAALLEPVAARRPARPPPRPAAGSGRRRRARAPDARLGSTVASSAGRSVLDQAHRSPTSTRTSVQPVAGALEHPPRHVVEQLVGHDHAGDRARRAGRPGSRRRRDDGARWAADRSTATGRSAAAQRGSAASTDRSSVPGPAPASTTVHRSGSPGLVPPGVERPGHDGAEQRADLGAGEEVAAPAGAAGGGVEARRRGRRARRRRTRRTAAAPRAWIRADDAGRAGGRSGRLRERRPPVGWPGRRSG